MYKMKMMSQSITNLVNSGLLTDCRNCYIELLFATKNQ